MKDFRLPGDDALLHFINGLNSPAIDLLFTTASTHVFGFGVAAALGVWLITTYRVRSWRPLCQAAIAAGAADAIGFRLLKPFFERIRPSFALGPGSIRVLAEAANVGSMPSLHAATSFAVATTMGILSPQVGKVAIPCAALISLSRVGVGVHWPSDVVVGAALGIGFAFGGEVLARRVFGEFDQRPHDREGQAAFARGAANIEAARSKGKPSGRR